MDFRDTIIERQKRCSHTHPAPHFRFEVSVKETGMKVVNYYCPVCAALLYTHNKTLDGF